MNKLHSSIFKTINKMTKNAIFVVLSTFLFQSNCTTESEHGLALIITNGFYQKISAPEEDIKYLIEFDYTAFGETCHVGGYSIQWDDQRASIVDWFTMNKLEPGLTYSISDTFNFINDDFSIDPIVDMQGYSEDVSETDSRLHARYRLKRR